MQMTLFPHQQESLDQTKDFNTVAYYLDMGLGKTFVGSEKMKQLETDLNILVCQKSKIDDWVQHFESYYSNFKIIDCSISKNMKWLIENPFQVGQKYILIINYDLLFRRSYFLKLEHFTLILDESSQIQNEKAKRSKFILNLNPANVVLLSGTPTSGKYENLWSQLHLLGWKISKDLYWQQYIDTKTIDNDGYPIKVVTGYKNVDRLKKKLREHGAVFMKSKDVLTLPEQIDQKIRINTTKEYRKFRKDCIVKVVTYKNQFCEPAKSDDETPQIELVGDTTLTKMLYERQLCGQYNKGKLQAFEELVESTEDRLIVFYNFNEELNLLKKACDVLHKPTSEINGTTKDLTNWEKHDNTILLGQYQSMSMGHNLQVGNKIIYFTPPLSTELFEQSKKRVHRIGQEKTCFYYYLTCKNSIEEKIYETLAMRKDFTDALFKKEE